MFNFDAYWDPIDLEELMRTVQHALKRKINHENTINNQRENVEHFRNNEDPNMIFYSRGVSVPEGEKDPDPNIIDHILDMLEDALNDDVFVEPDWEDEIEFEFEPIKTTHIFYKGKILSCDIVDDAYCLYPYEQWSDLEFIN